MCAPVVCRHDGSLMVLAYHCIYLKVAEAALLIHYLRPLLNAYAVLDYASGPVRSPSLRIFAPLAPEVICEFLVAMRLLVPYPLVQCLV